MRFLYSLIFIVAGFLSGAVMYSVLIPRVLMRVDIIKEHKDANPGAANAFKSCGVPVGLICLLCDMLKGAVPVFLAVRIVGTDYLPFAFIMAAPVIGHAFSPFMHFRGGKAIAVTFGVLLGLIPYYFGALLLAALYIVLALIRAIAPNERKTLLAFLVFSAAQFLFPVQIPVRLGCVAMSAAVIYRNLPDAKLFPAREGAQAREEIKER